MNNDRRMNPITLAVMAGVFWLTIAVAAFTASDAKAQQQVPSMMLCGPERWAQSILEAEEMVQATVGVLAGGKGVIAEVWVNPVTNDWFSLRRLNGAVCFTGRGHGWGLGSPMPKGDPS